MLYFYQISSGSNCTDYQSRRLNIVYEKEDGSLHYAHTVRRQMMQSAVHPSRYRCVLVLYPSPFCAPLLQVNATACAIPRTIIAILETHQTKVWLPHKQKFSTYVGILWTICYISANEVVAPKAIFCRENISKFCNIFFSINLTTLAVASKLGIIQFLVLPHTHSLLLSVFQEGTVRVPPVLQPYLGLEVIEKPKYTPLKYIGPNQQFRPPRPAPKWPQKPVGLTSYSICTYQVRQGIDTQYISIELIL